MAPAPIHTSVGTGVPVNAPPRSPFHGVCRSALRPRPRFSTPSTPDITRVDDTGTRPPPACDFRVPPRTTGSEARVGCRRNLRTPPTVQENIVAKPADGDGPRPAPVFTAPARLHARSLVRPSAHPLRPFAPLPPSFAHSAGRTLVRSSAHSNTRPSAHRSFARSLALSYVARFVHSSLARLSCFVSLTYRSLAR